MDGTLSPLGVFRRATLVGTLALVILAPTPALAQAGLPAGSPDSATTAEAQTARVLQAVRVQGSPPVIDGDLSDSVWETAPLATDFVQLEPREGEPATERTEVRILYDDEALYVAFRAYDSQPDSIAAQLTRRDQMSHSDRVHVIVDSYFDRRTAFHFAVNPVGVKLDIYRYEDAREDAGWDAVWDVATRIDSEGWTAEFRIPLSQLRFSEAPVQTWGINFARDIARRNELAVWSPLSQQDQAIVSRSGRLEGIRDLSPPRRLEVLPYSVARVTRAPGNPDNPFYERNDVGHEVGADLRMGVTSNLTLDLTVNPDFGQVEADPAQVNLTAFETFFPERRPFFQEGASIFRFGLGIGDGDGANQSLFYSRRIGRSPQGSVGAGAEWVDRPSQTRILAAGKLSGKTEGGWSVGVLNAVTGAEDARVIRGSEVETDPVEPLTNYSVLRLQRDFREGGSALGLIGTSTYRDGDVADRLALRSAAYTGGMDFRHRFRSGTLELRGYMLGSRVEGSSEAMVLTQRSSARYFQRPDADHVAVDSTATSMNGWAGTMELWKVGGGPWRFATATQVRSPGFEVNDLGFMPSTDELSQMGYVGYFQNQPGRHLRNWRLNVNGWSGWTFGGEHVNLGTNLNGGVTLNSNWSFHGGTGVNPGTLSPTLLRGGPALRTEDSYFGWAGANSDGRRDLQGSLNLNWNLRPESDSRSLGLSPSVRWRPSERATLRLGSSFSRRVDDRQWVGRLAVDDEPAYVFGRIEQTTLSLNLRADLAVTPTLSLQLYAQPFMSAGRFDDFKRVTDPRGRGHEDRFASLEPDQVGMSPDFNVKQFRSNAVLRWEYRPGSTLFLVWAQGRDHFESDGSFRTRDGFDTLFNQEPENVFMVKMNYWLNP